MQKPVVHYNKAKGTFEFIGEPQTLVYAGRNGASHVSDVIDAIKEWLRQNSRVTFKEIFKSMDQGNFGDLTEE